MSVTIAGSGVVGLEGVRFVESALVVNTAPTTTVNMDASISPILFYTSPMTSNVIVNLRSSSTETLDSYLSTVGKVASFTLIVSNNDLAAYNISSFQIDGVNVTPSWFGGIVPQGNLSSTDMYSIFVVKTSLTPTYSIFAGQAKYL